MSWMTLWMACSQGIVATNPPVGGGPTNPLPNEQEVTDTIVQVTASEVDVLFVLEPSEALTQATTDLTENLPFFLGYFLGSGIDYHIGLTSTLPSDADGKVVDGTGGLLTTILGYRYIDADTPNPSQIFTALADSRPSAPELTSEGLDMTLAAWSDNPGFRRQSASLRTILIADSDDESVSTVAEFVAAYDSLAEDRAFVPIVPTEAERYLDAAAQLESDAVSPVPGSDDWRGVLDGLGLQASGLRQEFFLSATPIENTLQVAVEQPIEATDGETNRIVFDPVVYGSDGEILNADPARTYEYVRSSNAVVFLQFVPEPLSRVVLQYTREGL